MVDTGSPVLRPSIKSWIFVFAVSCLGKSGHTKVREAPHFDERRACWGSVVAGIALNLSELLSYTAIALYKRFRFVLGQSTERVQRQPRIF